MSATSPADAGYPVQYLNRRIGQGFIFGKKTNSEMTQDKKTSLFILKNDQLEDSKIDLQLISSVAMMENYLMDVNYMFDYEKLSEYCMKYWMGKWWSL